MRETCAGTKLTDAMALLAAIFFAQDIVDIFWVNNFDIHLKVITMKCFICKVLVVNATKVNFGIVNVIPV